MSFRLKVCKKLWEIVWESERAQSEKGQSSLKYILVFSFFSPGPTHQKDPFHEQFEDFLGNFLLKNEETRSNELLCIRRQIQKRQRHSEIPPISRNPNSGRCFRCVLRPFASFFRVFYLSFWPVRPLYSHSFSLSLSSVSVLFGIHFCSFFFWKKYMRIEKLEQTDFWFSRLVFTVFPGFLKK